MTIDAEELNAGDYSAGFHILSNDPKNDDIAVPIDLHLIDPDEGPALRHFVDFEETDSRHRLQIAQLTFHDQAVPTGWEIGAFTTDERLAGAVIYAADEAVELSAWGVDPRTHPVEGFRDGESIGIRVWDYQADEEYPAQIELIRGGLEFEVDGFSVLNLYAYDPAAVKASPNVFVPEADCLSAGCPNPFNNSIRFTYGLHKAGSVNVSVYDISGKLIATLEEGRKAAGHCTVFWDGEGYPTGVYLVRMRTVFGVDVNRKVLLLR